MLSIEAMTPELRYVVYDDAQKDKPLRSFKHRFEENTFEILSVGPWLYAFEFNVDANGVQHPAPLRVISKEYEEQVFQSEGYVKANVFYTTGTTNDQYLQRVDATLHNPATIRVEVLRASSQKELYVHLLKQLTDKKMGVDMIQNVLDAFEDD